MRVAGGVLVGPRGTAETGRIVDARVDPTFE